MKRIFLITALCILPTVSHAGDYQGYKGYEGYKGSGMNSYTYKPYKPYQPYKEQGLGSNPNSNYVKPHVRKDGTYVDGYHRTNPNNKTYDNYEAEGNYNPYKY